MAGSKKKRRNQKIRQRVAKRYSKAREDAQLAGIIETVPAEAIDNEVVDPKTQGSQPFPGLIGHAVRNGWAVPEHMKPKIVDELIEIMNEPYEVVQPHTKVAAGRTLQQIDRDQWERDHPEEAGKMRGGAKVDVSVNNNTQVNLAELARVAATQNPVAEARQRALDAAKLTTSPQERNDVPVVDQTNREG